MRNPVMEQKKVNLDRVLNFIKAVGEIDYKLLLAHIEYKIGASRKKALEYIETLRDGRYIFLDGGKVYSRTAWENKQKDKPVEDIDKELKEIKEAKPVEDQEVKMKEKLIQIKHKIIEKLTQQYYEKGIIEIMKDTEAKRNIIKETY